MDDDDHTAHIKQIGVEICDQISCTKLDGELKAVLPTDTIMVDGWLLVKATAILAGCHTPTGSHSVMCGGRRPDAGKGGILSPSGALPDG